VLLGLSMSAFYGMVVANASWLVVESTIASGLLMSLGGLGASLMPLIAGIYAESSGIAAGLWVLFIAAALLLLLAVLNAIFPRK
jgi:fucose permease